MNRREQLQDQYEDALFALLMEDVIEAEGKRLLEENERLKQDPEAAVPDDVNKRCLKTIKRGFAKERRRTAGRVTYRVLNKAAMAAVVGALLFATAFAASPELRVRTLNLMIEVSKEYTTLTLNEDQNSPSASNGATTTVDGEQLLFGYRLPEVPEGFVVDYENSNDWGGGAYVQYINDEGATICIDIVKTHSGDDYIVDTEDAKVENIRIHGYDGLLIEKHHEFEDDVVIDSVAVVWGDTDQSTFVSVLGGNVDRELILNLATEVEFVAAAP